MSLLETMDNFEVDVIDRTIGSMQDRINAVIKGILNVRSGNTYLKF